VEKAYLLVVSKPGPKQGLVIGIADWDHRFGPRDLRSMVALPIEWTHVQIEAQRGRENSRLDLSLVLDDHMLAQSKDQGRFVVPSTASVLRRSGQGVKIKARQITYQTLKAPVTFNMIQLGS